MGDETFEISFEDLGIKPKQKILETTDLDINVYTDKVIGRVSNVTNNSEASYTLENAENGVYGWYAEVTDEFGGISRTNVNYFTVDKDITKPIITLPEENEFPIGYDFNPMDGVTANDDRDGDITYKITVEGFVDTSKSGNYTLTYQVVDNGGNIEIVSRLVTIKSIDIPNIDINDNNSNNSNNSNNKNNSNTQNSNGNKLEANGSNNNTNSNNNLIRAGNESILYLMGLSLTLILSGVVLLKKKILKNRV